MDSSSSNSLTDLLSLNKQPRLTCLLQSKQKIIASSDVQKFNDVNKCQHRILLLTDAAIYNIVRSQNFIKSMMSKLVSFQNKYTIRRRIPIQQLEAITLSNQQGNLQFVLHVQNQHDYRMKMSDYKNKKSIIKAICKQYQKIANKKLAFYFTDDITLVNKWTQKNQIKTCKSKMKKNFDGKPVYINFQDVIQYELPGVSFQLVYTWNSKNVDISNFKSISSAKLKEQEKYYSICTKKIKFEEIKENFENTHPFIALPDYVYKTSLSLYFLRPLYIGGKLNKLIQNHGPLEKYLFTFYMAQLVLALEFLHSKNWVYRNLTLDNIYIKSNGYLKLQGLTQSMKKRTNNSEKLYGLHGKEYNLPPEAIYCQGYDHQSDIWQLGICAYIMIKGKHPFAGKNKMQTFKNILQKQPFEFSTDKNIPEFIYKMLQKQPENRMKDMSQVKKDPWFQGYNWKKLEEQQINTLYSPEINAVSSWEGKIPSIMYLEETN